MRCCSLILAVAALSFAQEDVPLFKTGVSLVKVDAEVQNPAGTGISGLRIEDFRVYDEGQPQAISDFAAENEPVRILMVLDVSPSMSRWLSDLGVKSTEALRALRAGDEVGLMGFATRSELIQPLTTETGALGRKIIGNIYKQTLGGETHVNEALLEAAKYMRAQTGKGRKAILIVTDNEGARREVTDDQVVRALHAGDLVLSAIIVGDAAAAFTPGRYQNPTSGTPDVQRFVAETGGRVVIGTAPATALQPILKGLTTRYSFHYTAPQADEGTFRRIRVELAPQAATKYPGAKIKARSGYTVGQEKPTP
jgi:VWFA-related protein